MKHSRRLPRLCQRTSPSSGKTLAYATFNGRMVSFGPDGPEAQREFESFLASWLAAGRRLPDEGPEENPFTVGQLIDDYLGHLRRRHPEAWLANNYARIELSTRPLRELFGAAAVRGFSPLKLAAVRDQMIAGGALCRREINGRVRILRKMFTWACAQELISGDQAHGLAALDPLRSGDYGTRESKKVLPVAWKTVEATLPHLSWPVRAAVELLWWCGARPSEVLPLRPCDIDRSGNVWEVSLAQHKNAGRGKRRVLWFGPQAQAVLAPLLFGRGPERPLFSPKEAVEEMEQRKHSQRKTPRYPSHKARYRRERAMRDRREVGETYSSSALAQAVERAVDAENRRRKRVAAEAGEVESMRLEHWTPYQLRHAAATRIRKELGLEAVRCLLGHGSATMSEVYAEVDLQTARAAMAKTG